LSQSTPIQKAGRRSIAEVFASLRARGQIALMPFLTAGYPDLATTEACLVAMEAAGASLIEVGFPFSDPIADGPVIQESYTVALSKKLKIGDVFEGIKRARPRVSIPLVSMVSYSIVYRYGVDRFVATAKEAGFDGLILPDLPPPEAEGICERVRAGGLDTILLVAPTTTPRRRAEIAKLSSGFVYYLSVSGITGAREALPVDLAENVRQLKGLTEKPVCVGFGISKAAHVAGLRGVADGAIVGSAVVTRMRSRMHEGADAVAREVGNFTRELLGEGAR
jgi:tryptophan synthase alpha chain